MFRRAQRIVCTLLVALLVATSAAQVCREELAGALLDSDLGRPATGTDAVLVLKRAVDLVEPALPQLSRGGGLPIAADHPAYAAAKFLQDRRLLTADWSPDELDPQAWNTMLAAFLGWYEVAAPQPGVTATAADLVENMALALAEVSEAIRPAAILASDPENGDRLSFWAIIWNWTVYPRLLVVRPQEGVELSRDPRDVLPRLGNCAVVIDRYISAPEDTAKSLFLTHNDSRMYVVASEPPGEIAWPLEVQVGAELEAFDFTLPAVADVSIYAAVFDGPDVGIGKVLGLMTSVRTNMSPAGFFSYMQVP